MTNATEIAQSGWLDTLTAWVDAASGWVWGLPLIVAIFATGILLSGMLRFKHVRSLGRAFADGRKKWVYEVAIPFAELGVNPKAGLKLPFNVRVRNSQYGEWRQWDADGRTPQLLLQ